MSAQVFAGRTVAIFESRRQREFAAMFATRGAQVLECPLLQTAATEEGDDPRMPANTYGLAAFLEAILDRQFALVIFYTGAGVMALMDAAAHKGVQEKLIAGLGHAKRIARGPKVRATLRRYGLDPDLTADPATTEGIVEILHSPDRLGMNLKDKRIAAVLAGETLPDALVAAVKRRGAHLFPCTPYVHRLPDDLTQVRATLERIVQGKVDLCVFTTPPQVRLLFEAAEKLALTESLRQQMDRLIVGAVGPVTAAELHHHELTPTITAPAEQETMIGIVKALEAHLEAKGVGAQG